MGFAVGLAVFTTLCAAQQTYLPYQPIVTDQTALTLSNKLGPASTSVVNQNGDYAFVATGGTAVFLRKSGAPTPTRLLQHGDAVPGETGSRFDILFGSPAIRLNGSGMAMLGISYLDATGHLITNVAIYDGNSVQLLVRPSDVAPGTGGDLYGPSISPVGFDGAGDVAFTAILAVPTDPYSNLATPTLLIKPYGGAVVRVAGAGDIAPGTGGGTIGPIGNMSMNASGTILFRTNINGGAGGSAWYLGSAQGAQIIAWNGASTNSSTTLTSVGTIAALNNTGEVVFQATDANGVALWTWNSTTGITRLMGHGDAAPADIGGTLNAFSNVLALSDSGQFASMWTVTGGVAGGNVLLRYISAGQLETVAYGGEAAPGTATTFTFSSSSPVAIN
ncbi:MAG: DUF7453 family protein [Terriglobales bacterium]